jgi:hypothetical protein
VESVFMFFETDRFHKNTSVKDSFLNFQQISANYRVVFYRAESKLFFLSKTRLPALRA